jgi:hypothetical protein
MFPFILVPELSPASVSSFSQQQLTITEPQQLTNSLFGMDSIENAIPLLQCSCCVRGNMLVCRAVAVV